MFEFQDFMWKPAANRHIVNDSSPTGFMRARERWWVQDQPEIMAALQGWLDNGRELVGRLV